MYLCMQQQSVVTSPSQPSEEMQHGEAARCGRPCRPCRRGEALPIQVEPRQATGRADEEDQGGAASRSLTGWLIA